jgi:hypothetical protein
LGASSESGAPIGLVDSRGASASGVGIALSDQDVPGMSGSGMQMQMKDDTAFAGADLGLSGSAGGMPSPRGTGVGGTMSGTGLSGTATGRGGVNVFTADDSVEHADPAAQTAITPMGDAVNLEGVGSGSGLLDLTRESDDTSLGAELLDEIAPGGTKGGTRVGPADSGSGTATVPAFGAAARGRAAGPLLVEQADPMAAAFGGAALAGAIVLLIGGLSLGSAVMGTKVGLLSALEKPNAFMIVLGGGAVLALIFFIIGWIIGRSR